MVNVPLIWGCIVPNAQNAMKPVEENIALNVEFVQTVLKFVLQKNCVSTVP